MPLYWSSDNKGDASMFERAYTCIIIDNGTEGDCSKRKTGIWRTHVLVCDFVARIGVMYLECPCEYLEEPLQRRESDDRNCCGGGNSIAMESGAVIRS